MIEFTIRGIVQARRRRLKEPVADHSIEFSYRTKSRKAIVGDQLLNVELTQRPGLMVQLAKQKRCSKIG